MRGVGPGGAAMALGLVAGSALALDNGHVLPALGLSTWNTFAGAVSDALMRELADAMESSGLVAAGYTFLNLDDGWACCRDGNGTILPDPKLFPSGIKPVADYLHSKGLKMGIYTARGSTTCLGRPGSDSHEVQDAETYAAWGIDYLKEDSCGGTTHGTVWEQYAVMRDALNATGRPIWFSITEGVPFVDGHAAMHCYGDFVFTVFPWLAQGLDPTTLANSYLVEYCNNLDTYGYTGGVPTPGGFLSNLDAQQLLTFDNLTLPGAFNDNDMLTVCVGAQSVAEYRAQFSTWAILASPLILGNDPRSMTPDCLAIITNADVIAVQQDPLVVRGKLVVQWPQAVWPNSTGAHDGVGAARRAWVQHHAQGAAGAPPAPFPLAGLSLAPCNSTDPLQGWTYNGTGLPPGRGAVQDSLGRCLTYGGYKEANTFLGACEGWTSPGVGSQGWSVSGGARTAVVLNVADNAGKVLDVYDCNASAPNAVQVCSQGGPDCYAPGGAPPGCTPASGQAWAFDATAPSSPLASQVGGGGLCLSAAPLPAPPVDIRLQLWAKPLVGGSVAAVAFNRSPLPQVVNITWPLLGLPAGTAHVNVTDLWSKAWSVVGGGGFSATVPPHDVLMVRATPV